MITYVKILIVAYVDINECLVDNDGCEHYCTNLQGINNTTGLGYQCECYHGYQLAPNNHDCNGTYVPFIYIHTYAWIWSW